MLDAVESCWSEQNTGSKRGTERAFGGELSPAELLCASMRYGLFCRTASRTVHTVAGCSRREAIALCRARRPRCKYGLRKRDKLRDDEVTDNQRGVFEKRWMKKKTRGVEMLVQEGHDNKIGMFHGESLN